MKDRVDKSIRETDQLPCLLSSDKHFFLFRRGRKQTKDLDAPSCGCDG
jgi:hypothetical protein